jgi:hypothetical protein
VRCEAESPEDPLISSITLLLNSDQPSFIEQLQNESEETGLLRWTVRADLVATALDWLLRSEELSFDVNQEWPDGSVGAIAIEWLRSMGVESQAALQQLTEEMKREPGRFRQRCQAACALSVEESA